MIYKKPGEKFSHENITYTVAAASSPMKRVSTAGSSGASFNYCTDDDRETENDTPDIYCKFDPPYLSAAAAHWSRLFLSSMVRQSVWRI